MDSDPVESEDRYIYCDQIPNHSDTSFLNSEPVTLRLVPSLDWNSRKLLVKKHVDFIQINSRSYPHQVLNWCQLLKVFCPAENGLLPLVFKPSKSVREHLSILSKSENRKLPLKKTDAPNFFIGYYGEAKVWLVFTPKDREEVDFDGFDCESDCDFESVGPNGLPSFIDDVIMEAFGFGIYNVRQTF